MMSQEEAETDWIRQHRKHRVHEGAHDWLVCTTCGIPIRMVTRSAAEVLLELVRKH